MIKKILLFSLLIFSVISYSQNPDELFLNAMGFKEKVLINNKMRSFMTAIQEKVDGYEKELKHYRNDFDDPFYINIKSTQNSGEIIINNSSFPKPIVIEFESIYKKIEENEITYFFQTNNRNNSIYYIKKSGQNDTLLITIEKDDFNSTLYLYTISKI